ncbi:hypothetical protein D3C72_1985210 [compost metagenome]
MDSVVMTVSPHFPTRSAACVPRLTPASSANAKADKVSSNVAGRCCRIKLETGACWR